MTLRVTAQRQFNGHPAAVLLCLLSTCVSVNSAAQAVNGSVGAPPLPVNNTTPFTQLFISPTAPDYTLATGRHQMSSQFEISSHSIIQSADDTQLEIDGETLRLVLGWQYRPSRRWIVKAELPWLFHSGGFLDSSIDRWHALTGLPEGERNRQPRNALLFGFRDERQLLLFNRQQQALGDLYLSGAFQLHSTSEQPPPSKWQHNSWVQFGVKLPTGSAAKLSGSGATDVALSLHHNRRQAQSVNPWSVSADAFALITGDGDLIDRQESFQWQVNLKAAKTFERFSWIVPEVQLRYRSAAYDSPVNALGSDSLGVDVGATLHRASGYWKVGISEDLDVDSAPDVGFYLQYNRRLKTKKPFLNN